MHGLFHGHDFDFFISESRDQMRDNKVPLFKVKVHQLGKNIIYNIMIILQIELQFLKTVCLFYTIIIIFHN